MTNTESNSGLAAGVLAAINSGQLDSQLELLVQAANNRIRANRAVDAAETALFLTVGAQIKVMRCSPKYLEGATGTVSKIEGTKISFFLDYTIRKFSKNVAVTCDAGMLAATGSAGRDIPEYARKTGVLVG